nr:zinc finger, CCHC-type [Tanacetum cinerariifolium]
MKKQPSRNRKPNFNNYASNRGGGRGSRGGRGQVTGGMGEASNGRGKVSGALGEATGALGEASGALGEASGGKGQSNTARFQANTERGESSDGRGRARGKGGRIGMARGRGGRGRGRGGRGRGRGVTTMLVDEEEDAAEPPKLKQQGRKRKVAELSATEPPFRIYHKNIGRSKKIFNKKMKKTGFGPNGIDVQDSEALWRGRICLKETDMKSKFDKLVKFEGQDFRRWQKKMHFLITTLKVVYVLSTPSPVWSNNETLETTRKRMKWENDDYISCGHIQNGLRNQELDNNPKGKNQIGSPSVNMVERDGAKHSNNNKNKREFKSGDDKFANKKGTMTCWKCKKTGHMKKDCHSRKGNGGAGSNGSKDPVKQQESRDVIFDEEWFTYIHRPRGMIQRSSSKIAEDEIEGCKWILKRKMKVDGSIDKYKARLVIQGFRQKEGIDFFDTYATVARISTIRLLLALAAIHDLVIHQMDVKTTFLNGDLDEEIYMKQPEGFVMPQHKSKEFLSSKFDMKDLWEAEVILCIKIKRGNNDPTVKFRHNKGTPVSQLEYSRAIGCLIGYPSVIEGYSDANWINNMEDHSSTSGWIFLLG